MTLVRKLFKIIHVDNKFNGVESFVSSIHHKILMHIKTYDVNIFFENVYNEKMDAIIFNIKKPGFNGLEFLKKILEIKDKMKLNFKIIITYNKSLLSEQEILNHGADAVLKNPVSDLEISKKLMSMV